MVLVLKGPKVIAPFSEIGLLFSVTEDEVVHELESSLEGLVAAHEAEVHTVVSGEGVGSLGTVPGLVFTRASELDISLA